MLKRIFAISALVLPLSVQAHPSTSLGQAYKIVKSTNPDVLKARLEAEAEYFAMKSQKGALYPTIYGSYGLGYDRGITPTSRYSGVPLHSRLLSLSQLIFDGKQTIYKIKSAEQSYLRQRTISAQALNDISFELADAYLNVIRYKKQVALATKNEEIHVLTLNKMKQRFEQGAGRKSELSLARGRLATARSILYRQQASLGNARHLLEKLVGKKIHHLDNPSLPAKSLPKTRKATLAIALDQNPLIIASKIKLKASNYTIKQQYGQLMSPTLNLGINGSLNNNGPGVRGITKDLTGTLTLGYNFYRGGTDAAEYKKAIKDRGVSKQELIQSYRTVKQLVKTEWTDLQGSRKSISALTNSAASSKKTYLYYVEEFKLGKRSLLNVLDSQNELFTARSVLTDAKFQYAVDHFALLASMGKLPNYLARLS